MNRPADPLPELWRAVEHVARSRLAVLDHALRALQRQDRDAPARCSAAFEESHKLVGSLDSFGRTGGSALALRAAVLLSQPAPDVDALREVLDDLRRTVDGPDAAPGAPGALLAPAGPVGSTPASCPPAVVQTGTDRAGSRS